MRRSALGLAAAVAVIAVVLLVALFALMFPSDTTVIPKDAVTIGEQRDDWFFITTMRDPALQRDPMVCRRFGVITGGSGVIASHWRGPFAKDAAAVLTIKVGRASVRVSFDPDVADRPIYLMDSAWSAGPRCWLMSKRCPIWFGKLRLPDA